jgi:multiple sugar transport system permease protein
VESRTAPTALKLEKQARRRWSIAGLSESPAWAYLLLAPAMLLLIAITFYPILDGISLSFFTMQLNKPWKGHPFVGLANYVALVQDPVFQLALENTVLWTAGTVISQFALGLLTAVLLNRPLRGMRVFSILVLLPWVMPIVVGAQMWAWMFDFQLGVINSLLLNLHLITQSVPWLANPNTALPAAMIASLWKGFPFFAIVLLAGLQSIPPELYEAAAVDGASLLQRFQFVTLPLLWPFIVITTTLRVIWTFNSADLIYVMTGGGPGNATQILPVYAFTTAYGSYDFGYASAIACVMLLILIVFTVFYVRISRITEAN